MNKEETVDKEEYFPECFIYIFRLLIFGLSQLYDTNKGLRIAVLIQMWIQKDRWKRRWSFSFNGKESQDLFSTIFGILPCSRSSLRPSSMILHLINSPNCSFYILHTHKAFVERQIVTNRILYNIVDFFPTLIFLKRQ